MATAEPIIHPLQDRIEHGELLVNLRAEGDPEVLREALTQVTALGALRIGIDWMSSSNTHERFRPPKPEPTYRMADGLTTAG